MFGPAYEETADRLGSLARSTIECLGRSDALYHNMEHTLLVTLVGRDILHGLSLSHRIEPDDYSHLVCRLLLEKKKDVRRDQIEATHHLTKLDKENWRPSQHKRAREFQYLPC